MSNSGECVPGNVGCFTPHADTPLTNYAGTTIEKFDNNCSGYFRRALRKLGLNLYKSNLLQVAIIFIVVKLINHYFKYDFNVAYVFIIYFITVNTTGMLTGLDNKLSDNVEKKTMRHPFITMIVIMTLSFFIYKYLGKTAHFNYLH